jgi:hypothetical protein
MELEDIPYDDLIKVAVNANPYDTESSLMYRTINIGAMHASLRLAEEIESYLGYSGVGVDGNPYDTPSWNAAIREVVRHIRGF